MTEKEIYKLLDELDSKSSRANELFKKKYMEGGLIKELNYDELEKLENNNFTREEITTLMALTKSALKNNIARDYSLRPAVCEDMSCLYKSINNTWISYNTHERNGIGYVIEFDNLYEACLFLIDRTCFLYHDIDFYSNNIKIKEDFNNYLEKDVSDNEIKEYIDIHNRYVNENRYWTYEKNAVLKK